MSRYRLLLDLPDRRGIVKAVSAFLGDHSANVLELDSHAIGDPTRFYLRVEFELDRLADERQLRDAFLRDVAGPIGVECWDLWPVARRKRVCLLVSRYDHCFVDLLTRWRQGELPCDIGLVVSNHPDMGAEAQRFGVPYRQIAVTKDTKAQAEAELLDAVAGEYDLLVLARYMQILSGEFLERVGAPVINIHHSFLPAFAGADPYARAQDRGVKLIGATAHYVTTELDAGPIIEQDVARVNHRASVDDMTRAGRDVERTVLARAVNWHLEDRVAVHGNRTIVFA